MVDTFTCDSCGRNSVPDTEKRVILLKESVPTGQLTTKGKPQMQTVTIGMDICPDCKLNGVIRSHVKVSGEGQPDRFFTWNPNPKHQATYVWGQQNDKKDNKQ